MRGPMSAKIAAAVSRSQNPSPESGYVTVEEYESRAAMIAAESARPIAPTLATKSCSAAPIGASMARIARCFASSSCPSVSKRK